MNVIWCVILIALLLAELSTANLTTIWFAGGALFAWFASLLKAPLWLQILVFFIVSIVTLILTRPLVKKMMARKVVPTNADRAVGKEAWVTATVDNTRGEGIVNLEGSDWSAISESGEVLAEGTRVVVREIRGVKLVVSKAE
ncbi:MAG: NfeD family protein [Clostridia bacterium]|nr:NfeD family protein [Oscillospiraceae bacterium]MBQ2748491.1 NfeD family protein [Clostridia bacterium]MBQ6990532.1 NfeD family protein [Clostridia bacterium]MBR6763931.1 NfeD family protein [Clostridia bacterium]